MNLYSIKFLCSCPSGETSHSGSTVQLRENFARACFEALLQFSFMQNKDSTLGET